MNKYEAMQHDAALTKAIVAWLDARMGGGDPSDNALSCAVIGACAAVHWLAVDGYFGGYPEKISGEFGSPDSLLSEGCGAVWRILHMDAPDHRVMNLYSKVRDTIRLDTSATTPPAALKARVSGPSPASRTTPG